MPSTVRAGAASATATRNAVDVDHGANWPQVKPCHAAVDDNTVDTYLNASQMVAANWNNVITVAVTLTFTNPIYVAGGGQPQTITFQRVVGVMGKAGIKI